MTESRVTFARLSLASAGGLCAELQVRPTLSQQIKEKQLLDGDLLKKIRQVEQGVKGDIDINAECILNFRGRLCVPQNVDLRQVILNEVHSSPYPMHPVDRFLKSAHFVAVRTNSSLKKLAELYIAEIVRLYGVQVSIISDRDLSFQASIHMAPFEALYGKKCRNPLCWTKLDEKRVVGVDLDRETEEKVKLKCERLKEATNRYKSYVDLNRRDNEFQIGDKYLSDSLHIVPVEEIEVQPNLTFDEEPIEILDHEMKVL
ncbi:uncharacterized protein LOC105786799 [Gossypium raimondii]|uniref:uncharacterized protein LOC105786799 n=1 Tax=Gossypium raimondii TaxID=29730 RepID=UPI00063AA271|nr:uncharacterized protein LOC105786799 [Gossypium raimondii]